MRILDFINIRSIQPFCVAMGIQKERNVERQSSVAMEIKYNIMS